MTNLSKHAVKIHNIHIETYTVFVSLACCDLNYIDVGSLPLVSIQLNVYLCLYELRLKW